MKQAKIQRVELCGAYDVNIHCPFCGQLVVDYGDPEDSDRTDIPITPCPHTLFVAHDEGFEYRSGAFDKNLGVVGVPDEDLPPEDSNIDQFTDGVTVSDAVKFASYVSPPSGFGAYVGFAPSIDD